jgi:hypothetical protein
VRAVNELAIRFLNREVVTLLIIVSLIAVFTVEIIINLLRMGLI